MIFIIKCGCQLFPFLFEFMVTLYGSGAVGNYKKLQKFVRVQPEHLESRSESVRDQ